jgi:hypothetical protein
MVDIETAQAFDPKTGEKISGDQATIQGLAKQGKAGFQKGTTVDVLDPSGRETKIEAEDASAALDQGYTLPSEGLLQKNAVQKKYGGTGGEILAGAAGAARGLSLGLSDLALTKSGLVSPDTLQGLKDANPDASTAGDVAGSVLPAVLTGGGSVAAEGGAAATRGGLAAMAGDALAYTPAGLVGKAGAGITKGVGGMLGSEAAQGMASKIVRGAASHAVGSAVEGAAFGAGGQLSEAALGDPEKVADHAIANIGFAGLLGFGLGGALGAVSGGIESIAGKKLSQQAVDEGAKAQIAESAAAASEKYKAPQSLQGVMDKVEDAKYSGAGGNEVPSRQTLMDATDTIGDLSYPPHEIQLEAMSDKKSYDIYKTALESQTQEGQALQSYEGLQKQEGVAKLNSTVENLAPGRRVTADPYQGGQEIVEAFSDHSDALKKAEKGLFEKFDEVAPNLKVDPLSILPKLSDAIPQADSILKVNAEGTVELAPYSPKTGISKTVYDALADVHEAMKDGNLSIAELRNVRNTLSDRVNMLNPKDAAPIGKLKKSLMDYIEEKAQTVIPDIQVRQGFKNYAVASQNLENMEKVFGGSFSDRASLLKQVKPEQVGDKVFRNSATVSLARETLPSGQFDKLLANYMAEQVAKFTDKGTFSSQRFASWMKSNSTELQLAFKGKEGALARFKALGDYMRILPDAPSINPSGTAKTSAILDMVHKLGGAVTNPAGTALSMGGGFLSSFKKGIQDKIALGEADAILARKAGAEAKASQFQTYKKLEDASAQISKRVKDGVQNFIQGKYVSSSGTIVPASVNMLSNDSSEHKGKSKSEYAFSPESVLKATSSPQSLIDNITQKVAGISKTAPNVSDVMIHRAVVGMQFLASKAPQNPYIGNTIDGHLIPWKPSDAATAKYMRYARGVQHPMSIIDDLEKGTLTKETVEAVQTVYPTLYSQVVTNLIQEMGNANKPIPYKNKVQVGVLFRSPTDASLRPGFVAQMQNNHLQAQLQDAHNNNASQTGMSASKISRSDGAMTDTQKLLTRG